MRHIRGIALLAVGTLLFSGCNKATSASADSATVFDESAAKAQILGADSAFVRGLTSKHVDSLMIYYAPEVVSMSEGSKAVKDTANVRKAYGEMVKSNPRDLTFQSEGVYFSNDHSMAWDYGTLSVTVDGPNGKPVKATGNGLNVWKNVGGRWLIVAEISNSSQ